MAILLSQYTKKKLQKAIICFMILFVIFVSIGTLFIDHSRYDDMFNGLNNNAKLLKSKDIFNLQDKIYYISCGSAGLDFYYIRYLMVPAMVDSSIGWSLGIKRYERDYASYDIEVDKFIEKLEQGNYTHVYIYNGDNIFKAKYHTMFENGEIKQNTIYKIKKEDGKIILLKI